MKKIVVASKNPVKINTALAGFTNDMVFKKENSKQSNGAVGILTNDVLTRTTYYEPAVILALIPFKNSSLY